MASFFLLQFLEGFALYLIIITLARKKGKISLFMLFFLTILHGSIYYVIDKLFPFQLHGLVLIILSILISSLVLELDFILATISALISILVIISLDFTISMLCLAIIKIPITEIINNTYIRTNLTFFVQVCFLGVAIILNKKNFTLPKKYFVTKKTSILISSLFFIICVFALFALIISSLISSLQSLMYVFLIITFISFSFVIYKLNQYIVYMAMKEIQLEEQKIYIEYIKELMNHLKSQRHEFINHINVLYGLVQIKDLSRLETAKRYIENLNITIQGTSKVMATNEPVVSGLLFTKTAIAEQKNIELDVHITDKFTDTSLSLTEISVILNNLINNAIEFTENLPEENRYIYISRLLEMKIIYT